MLARVRECVCHLLHLREREREKAVTNATHVASARVSGDIFVTTALGPPALNDYKLPCEHAP